MSERRPVAVIGAGIDLGQGRRGVDMGPSAIRYAELNARLRDLDGIRCFISFSFRPPIDFIEGRPYPPPRTMGTRWSLDPREMESRPRNDPGRRPSDTLRPAAAR